MERIAKKLNFLNRLKKEGKIKQYKQNYISNGYRMVFLKVERATRQSYICLVLQCSFLAV